MSTTRVIAQVSGRVQGVGFRAWVRREATTRGLTGSAANLSDGSVRVDAQGDDAGVAALIAALRGDGPPGRVAEVIVDAAAPDATQHGFEIR